MSITLLEVCYHNEKKNAPFRLIKDNDGTVIDEFEVFSDELVYSLWDEKYFNGNSHIATSITQMAGSNTFWEVLWEDKEYFTKRNLIALT